ncbi:MAG: rod shape-determining protein MreD [Bacteroidaceae bacterium]|nr:rod shape-determining protein MreD [Bacteroidaceae bacterium]
MLPDTLTKVYWFVGLLLLQVVLLDHIALLGYAIPMPYVYFFCLLPTNTPRWVYVATGFALGLLIDVFTATPGVGAAACCATGLAAPYLLQLFAPSGYAFDEPFVPSSRTMEWMPFLRFAVSLVLLNCFLYFLLEAFTLMYFGRLLLTTLLSTLLSTAFIAAIEKLRAATARPRGLNA